MADSTTEISTALLALLLADGGIDAIVGNSVFDTYVPEGVKPPWVRFYTAGESSENVFQRATPIHNRNVISVDGAAVKKADAKTLVTAIMSACDGTSLSMDTWEGSLGRTAPARKFWDDVAKQWVMSADYLIVTTGKK